MTKSLHSCRNVFSPLLGMGSTDLSRPWTSHLFLNFRALSGIRVSSEMKIFNLFGMRLPKEGVVFSSHIVKSSLSPSAFRGKLCKFLARPLIPTCVMLLMSFFIGGSAIAHTPKSISQFCVMPIVGCHLSQQKMTDEVFSGRQEDQIGFRIISSHASRDYVMRFEISILPTSIGQTGAVDDGVIPSGIFAFIEHDVFMERLGS